jgi:hypothetical protein
MTVKGWLINIRKRITLFAILHPAENFVFFKSKKQERDLSDIILRVARKGKFAKFLQYSQ